MKKLKNLTFACLLILGLAACADEEKSSNNPPVIDNTETVTLEFNGEIGKDNVNTITFTNPHAVDADLEATIYQYTMEGSVVFDTANSTCDEFVNSNGNYKVRSKLAAGASCEIKYTYKPTELNTKLLWIDANYNQSFETVCPTQDTVPTLDQLMNTNKYVQIRVFNYAVNDKNEKSPKINNIKWTVPYSLNREVLTDLEKKTFQITLTEGDEYNYYNNTYFLRGDETNCKIIEGNKLTALKAGACTITVKKNTANNSSPLNTGSELITFEPANDNTKPYYNALMEVDSEVRYKQAGSDLKISYIAGNLEDIYVLTLDADTNIKDYKIDGADADKFKVVGTKYNGCTVTDTEISVPSGQNTCFFTVEMKDPSVGGEFNATISGTMNGKQMTLNINAISYAGKYLDDVLKTYCQNKDNGKDNNQYKLF